MPDDRDKPEGIPEPIEAEDTGRVSERFAANVAPGGAFDEPDPTPAERPTAGGTGRARTHPAPEYINPELTPLPPPPPGPHGDAAAAFLDQVAIRVARRVPTPIPERRYAGLTGPDWIKLAVGPLLAALLFLGAWYATVNRELDRRPTREAVEKAVHTEIEVHSEAIHPPAAKRLESLDQGQQAIREGQIRSELVDTAQTETLRVIRNDVRQLRRKDR